MAVHDTVPEQVPATRSRLRSPRFVVPLLVVLGAHAVLSELVQAYLLPERTGDWRDVVADVMGVAAGFALGRRSSSVAPGRERRASS